ncbi:MAG: DUF3160 domain-containing protein [Myxococcota bacterium]
MLWSYWAWFLGDVQAGSAMDDVEYLAEVVEELGLSNGERQTLETHGMALLDRGRPYSMGSAYYHIYTADLPVLITSDSLLHALHRNVDDMVGGLEVALLVPLLGRALQRAHESLPATASLADRDVDEYLAVARNLLVVESEDDDTFVASRYEANAKVKRMVKRAREERDLERLAVRGSDRVIDFGQFAPRGHYAIRAELQAYFQAMMWLGRADVGFHLQQPREMAAAARLAEVFVASGADRDLDQLDDLLTWLVGPSDNLSVRGLVAALDGAELSAADLADAATAGRFAKGLDAQQAVRSQFVPSDPQDPEEAEAPLLFQVLGQRATIDSVVLSRLVFDSILHEGVKVKRMMPTGLDVAAALGNDHALGLLGPEMTRWHYQEEMAEMRAMVESRPRADWQATLVDQWFDALRTLHTDLEDEPHVPQVMKRPAWRTKQLQTQLASWSELRHDMVLYAKPSYTAYPMCEYPTGYVEPYPAFYEALANVGDRMVTLLRSIDLAAMGASDPAKRLVKLQLKTLGHWSTVMQRLKHIAEQELAGKELSAANEAFLKKTIDIRGGGSGPPTYSGWYPSLFYRGGETATEWLPQIVDVHTDPESGRVLEVGTGTVHFVVVKLDHSEQERLYVGPVSSYYEFTQPSDQRLTDQDWEQMLRSKEVPSRPVWMTDLVSPPFMKKRK